jgi:hypothetical protein
MVIIVLVAYMMDTARVNARTIYLLQEVQYLLFFSRYGTVR